MNDGEEKETERICEQCGSPVPKDSPGGMCPKCLVGGVLGSESADDWLNPLPDRTGEKVGDWEILGRLGEGAFGEVFHVIRVDGEEECEGALKILKAGLNSREAMARFDAEGTALARLNHPNITRIFDSGQTEDGQPWFVMEFVDGKSVTDFCRFGNLPVRERLEIFLTVCEAVDHAHDQGIVHRDLKPSNVLVARGTQREPVVKLIDFGVAKAMDLPLTQKTLFTHSGVLIGTPEYMSPEQASGRSLDLDARADVYSLGVLLYELLTGTTPITPARFREAAFDEVLRLVREVEARRPSTASQGAKFAPELDWIALKALDKDRDRRYADSGELAADISRYLNSKPVAARKPGRIYRVTKFIRRNRFAAAGTATACGFVLIAAAAGWWWSDRSTTVSPGLLAASEFRPAPMPPNLPDTPEPADPDVIESSINIENYPETLARLCRQLRDNPDDDHPRFRLWGLLTIVQFPERIGDPIIADDEITGARLLPEQNLAVVISRDGIFRAFSLADGEKAFEHDCGSALANLTVSIESGIAAASGENGSLFIFNFTEGGQFQQFFAGTAPVTSLALDNRGALLFSGDETGKLQAWSVKTGGGALWENDLGSSIRFLNPHYEDPIIACGLAGGEGQVFAADNGTGMSSVLSLEGELAGIGLSHVDEELITATASGRTQIWNYRTGQVTRNYQVPGDGIRSFVSDPHASVFLSGTDREGVVCGMTSAEFIRRAPHRSGILSADLGTGSTRYFVTGHGDATWRTWNLRYRRAEIDPVPFWPGTPVHYASITNNGKSLIVAGGRRAQMWDLAYRPVKLGRYQEAGYVTEMAVIPGTGLIRFMGPNGSILFKLDSTAPAGQAMPIPLGSTQTALSKDGLWISAAYGNRVRTWKAPVTGEAIPMREIFLDSPVSALALGPDGRTVAIATEIGTGGVWEPETGRRIFRLKLKPIQFVCSAAVDHPIAAFGTRSGSVDVYDLETGAEVEPGIAPFEGAVDRLEISSRGTLAAGARDGTGRLFDPGNRRQIGGDLHHTGGIVSLDFSPDGRWITCGTRNQYCAHWDARDGRYLFRSRRWAGEMVLAGMNADQTHLVQCSTSSSGPSLQRIPPHNEPVPPILLDFAEAYVGFRIDQNGERQEIPFDEYDRLRAEMATLPEDGTRVRHWLRFIAKHPATRNSVPDW